MHVFALVFGVDLALVSFVHRVHHHRVYREGFVLLPTGCHHRLRSMASHWEGVLGRRRLSRHSRLIHLKTLMVRQKSR